MRTRSLFHRGLICRGSCDESKARVGDASKVSSDNDQRRHELASRRFCLGSKRRGVRIAAPSPPVRALQVSSHPPTNGRIRSLFSFFFSCLLALLSAVVPI